jgi:hypothetical protein
MAEGPEAQLGPDLSLNDNSFRLPHPRWQNAMYASKAHHIRTKALSYFIAVF